MVVARTLLFAIACVVAVGACGNGPSCGRYSDCDYAYDAMERMESYDDHADPADVDASDVEEPGFVDCTDDCSGHEAGFEWAQTEDLVDDADCGGDSESFVEGCQAFVEARQEQADQQAIDDADARAEAESEQDDYMYGY